MNNIFIKNKIESNKAIKIATFKKDIRKTSPHKHNSYFEIIYLSSGTGFHYIDSLRYEIRTPVVFIVLKEQVHFWELSTEPEGYVLIIKKEYIDQVSDGGIKRLLNALSVHPALQLKQSKSISAIFELLLSDSQEYSSFSSTILEGLIKVLLAKLLDDGSQYLEKRKPDSNLYYQFRELLSQEKNFRNNVNYYASQLNVSSQNLNYACRKFGNVSASAVLSEFIINESKRLLIYTDRSIKEISMILNFSDSSHFVKYFKKVFGITPQIFRNSQ
ncbi:MAG: helix-turn-helix transcriptional regulator [Pedobacter sp.]|jgi:AraC-like DNA-binding protein